MITKDYTELGGKAYSSGCTFSSVEEAQRVSSMNTFKVFVGDSHEEETWRAENATELVKAFRATYAPGTEICFCQVIYTNHKDITL